MKEGGGRRVSGVGSTRRNAIPTASKEAIHIARSSHVRIVRDAPPANSARLEFPCQPSPPHPPSPRHILCPVASPPRIPFPPSAFPLSSTQSTQCKTLVSMKNKKLVSRRILPIESNSLETSASFFDLNRRPILYPTFILIFR